MSEAEVKKAEIKPMKIDVVKFFERLESDPELKDRLHEAELLYPGSLEIREPVVEYVLLPIAAELGYYFDVEDVRKYETRLKFNKSIENDKEAEEYVIDENPHEYWLLERGWTNDSIKEWTEENG